jgi:hypothetical protein
MATRKIPGNPEKMLSRIVASRLQEGRADAMRVKITLPVKQSKHFPTHLSRRRKKLLPKLEKPGLSNKNRKNGPFAPARDAVKRVKLHHRRGRKSLAEC